MSMDISIAGILGRLILAVALGGLVGVEREIHGRAAGFRTHILVCTGAALVMLVSIYGFPTWSNSDPGRLAAQVVSGIGFLGAGTILREGASVRGLTTAASLWVVAGIGLAVGSGFYVGAAAGTFLAVTTLQVLNRLERRFLGAASCQLDVCGTDRPGLLAELSTQLTRHGADIRSVKILEGEEEAVHILFVIQGIKQPQLSLLMETLQRVEGVKAVGCV